MRRAIFLLAIIISTTTIIADNPIVIKLDEGKNNFTIEEYFPTISIKELMEENPGIKSASTNVYGTTYGYVEAFGGLGTNFLVEPGRTYEIYVNESMEIYLRE